MAPYTYQYADRNALDIRSRGTGKIIGRAIRIGRRWFAKGLYFGSPEDAANHIFSTQRD